jgi:hypothetical protein
MTDDLWDVHPADLDAFKAGVSNARALTSNVGGDPLTRAGLLAAFASLRNRVGEPAGQLTSGPDAWEYKEITFEVDDTDPDSGGIDRVNELGADGWRVIATGTASDDAGWWTMERSVRIETPEPAGLSDA